MKVRDFFLCFCSLWTKERTGRVQIPCGKEAMASVNTKLPFIIRNLPVMVDPPAIWHGPSAWSWNTRIPNHYFNLWVLLSGSVAVTLRGRVYERSQPCYFLLPPGERIDAVNSGPGPKANFTLHVASRGAARGWQMLPVASTWGQPVRQFDQFAELARACVAAGHRTGPAHQAYAAALGHALLLRFWIDVTEPLENPACERMYDLAGRIRQHPEAAWRIGALAAEAGYSRSRFTRLFAEANELPPREFITRCRMERARALLQESTMSISEIAYALGYSDVFFFSRHFKEITGLSPLAYRRRR